MAGKKPGDDKVNALLLQPYDPSSGSSSGRTQLGGSASPGDQAFAAVFDSSAEALLVIEQGGAIVRANRRAAELLRLRDAAVRDSNLRDFVSGQPEIPSLEDWVQNTFAAFPPTLDSSLANGFPVRITLRAILPGEDLLLCIEEGPMVQRAEAKSNQVEAELRTLLDSAREGAVLFDREGRVRFAGAAFGQMFGIEARALQASIISKTSTKCSARVSATPPLFRRDGSPSSPVRPPPRTTNSKWFVPFAASSNATAGPCSAHTPSRSAGSSFFQTSPASARFSPKCCKPKKWPRSASSFPALPTS